MSVSSVLSFKPTFCMRLSLSSMRWRSPYSALALAKMFSGWRAASPYASFFLSKSSLSSLHLAVILSLVFI